MAYRALYRQWRPKDFSHMVGQKAIIETLRNQVVTGRIAHAYLFCGSRGTGKTSTAKILARAINCLNPANGDPCGECENCRRMEMEETLDIIEIDAASNNGVDEMRDLRDTVKYPPQFGKYKVYIIDEVHMLSTSAFNALLKTLEEPPEHVVFILATTEPQKLPETILSRCQRFDFGRISMPEIAGRLREAVEGSGAEATDGALMLIARAAEGGMRDALSLLDMCLGYRSHVDEDLVRTILGSTDSSFLFEYCDALSGRDTGKVFSMIDTLMRDGKDPAVFARDVCRHIRSLLIAKACPEELAQVLDITLEEAADLVRQAESFTITRLMSILDLYLALEGNMRYSSTPRLALENTSLKCCVRTAETDSQALNDRITELEKQVSDLMNRLSSGSLPAPAPAAAAPAEKKPSAAGAPGSAAPARTRKPASGGSPDAGAWTEMLNRFKKTEPSIWSFLTQGNPAGIEGNTYIWQASAAEGEKLFINTLNKPDISGKISAALTEITGQPCSFSARERGREAPAAGNRGEEDYLQKLRETFGSEPVSVVEKL